MYSRTLYYTARYILNVPIFLLGYVKAIDGMVVAVVCNQLGAGRQFSNQQIDPAVGVQLLVRVGDRISSGAICMVLHHNEIRLDQSHLTSLQNAIELTDEVVEPESTLLGVIDCKKTTLV